MSDREHNGVTTRYEAAGQIRRPSKKMQAAAQRSPPVACEKQEIFPSGPGPRYFGEGSYLSGGSVAEGNYAPPDSNHQGGYGNFDDAGGPGATQLLGRAAPQACTRKNEGRRPGA